MQLSPFVKGALGFGACAAVCTVAYKIGKSVGREETLKEVDLVEREERCSKVQPVVVQAAPEPAPVQQTIVPVEEPVEDILPAPAQQTTSDKVRKMHGWRNTIFGGTSVIKDLLRNPDGKKLVLTVENGDVVARISQNQGG